MKIETLVRKKIRFSWLIKKLFKVAKSRSNDITISYLLLFFRECGFVWSVSEESEQVLMRWEHAWTTWRSDLIGLVLAFNFSFFTKLCLEHGLSTKSFHLARSLASSKFLRPTSQLLQCSRSFQRFFPSIVWSETPFWATSRAMTCSLLTLIRHSKILQEKSSVTKKNYLKISPIIW